MKRLVAFLFFCALPLFGQSNTGELRLKVIDPAGAAVKTAVEVVSQANQYRNSLATDDEGKLDLERLPFGIYQVTIAQEGFAAASESVEIRSSIPTDLTIQLKLTSVSEAVTVSAVNTLIDPTKLALSARSALRPFKTVSLRCLAARYRIWLTRSLGGSMRAMLSCTRARPNIRPS